jgi:hypothetical protein
MKLLLIPFISLLLPQRIIIDFPFSDSLFVGEKEELSIIIESNNNEEYIFPELSVENEDISISSKENMGNKAIYTLYFWNDGEFTFPSFNIFNENDTLKTDEFTFHVYNSQKNLDETIKANKRISNVSLPWKTYQIILLFAIIVSAVLIYFLTRKKELGIDKKFESNPIDLALKQLESIDIPNSNEKADVNNFYINLTDIIKECIKAKLFFRSTEMTTEELLLFLERKNVNIDILNDFLKRADIYKFSNKNIQASDVLNETEIVKNIILKINDITN